MAAPTYEQVLREAEQLPLDDQLLLIERLVSRLRGTQAAGGPRLRWEDFAGSAPYPLCGEDAQEWVSRTREESDQGRKIQ